MVHQMMAMKIRPAPSASSKSNSMRSLGKCVCCLIVGILAACSSPAPRQAPVGKPAEPVAVAPRLGQPVMTQAKSRWVAVDWSALPGLAEDALHEAWTAWTRSCEKPSAAFVKLCSDVRRLSIADAPSQRAWMLERLQPYRVESLQGDTQGLLTGYFEPTLEASRVATANFSVPLFQTPANLGKRKPWFTRQEADTVPEAQSALRDRAIAYLADPVDAQVLQIQGSGQLRVTQSDGSIRRVRLAYAGSNDHPYRSIGKWLLDRGLVRDASWAGIKAWIQQNPQREQELLWVNPRLVFFREVPAADLDAFAGPMGAQGVALTAGRSIAVDPGSIPYGTPVWISAQGPAGTLNKLVLAQDTGHAISGAVRADYFVGSGPAAGESAGRLRQALQAWVLWPK
ncbi:MAG: transglycosylase [Burkholderiales bacterium PBB3]|nr:MAG: transglycosylase [Burkholderiales bacterium PBB3]